MHIIIIIIIISIIIIIITFHPTTNAGRIFAYCLEDFSVVVTPLTDVQIQILKPKTLVTLNHECSTLLKKLLFVIVGSQPGDKTLYFCSYVFYINFVILLYKKSNSTVKHMLPHSGYLLSSSHYWIEIPPATFRLFTATRSILDRNFTRHIQVIFG